MTLAFIFGLSSAHAVPVQLGQQGRLLDASGAAINGSHLLSFRIAESGSSTNFLWEESLTVSFQDGYYSAVLGANNASNPLDDSILQSTPLFLEIEVDANGPLTPRQEITSTPFSRLAGSAQNLLGGTADASELKIGGVLVIDGSGSWVGPTMITNWVDITGVPADIADGDDDTLAGISCQTGQILGWNGSAWGCTDDNGLTESQVEAFVTNDPLNLALGSMVGGVDIVTTSTDQDRLSDLSCQNGDVAKYDSLLGWQCGLDNDSTNWNDLNNIPPDIADGDDVLDAATVEGFVTDGPIDLAAGTTIDGGTVMMSQACQHGEVLSYDSVLGDWTCASFQSMFDNDGDGVMAWSDCDDSDPNQLSSSNDADCDGTITALDCDDGDPTSTTLANDADCDGHVIVDDCNDNDPNMPANDQDCDGVASGDDCDDSDPSVFVIGSDSFCPAANCLEILNADPTSTDGLFWIAPSGMSAFQAYCDMTTDGGGWTLVATVSASNQNHVGSTGDTNVYNSTTPIPFESTQGGRKLSDATVKSIATEAVVRVELSTNQARPNDGDFKYRAFFKLNDFDQFSFANTGGPSSVLIYTSHVYPYSWEEDGGGDGYHFGCDSNYKVFDHHNSTCNSSQQWDSSEYPTQRILYGYVNYPGIHGMSGHGEPGYTWVR